MFCKSNWERDKQRLRLGGRGSVRAADQQRYFVGTLSRRPSQLLFVLFLLSLSPPPSLPPILIKFIWTAPHWLPLLFLLSIGLFVSPSLYPLTLYLSSKGSQGSLTSVPTVLFKHLPHPFPGPVRDVEKQRIKLSARLRSNMYASFARACVCVCVSTPERGSGSLLVCMVDSQWTHR